MKQYKLYSRGDANVKKKWLFYEQMEFLGPYFDKYVKSRLHSILFVNTIFDTLFLSFPSIYSTEFKYEADDYIETIQAETDNSMDKPNMGPQIVCINSDGGEYTHQIEVDEYQDDQMDEDALDTSQYVNNKGSFKESSSVYYISAPTSNSTTANTESQQSQSSQRQTKMVSNAAISSHNDPDERFLLSCLPIMKRLPTRKNALARLKIQQLLYEIEFDAYPEVSGQ